MEQEALQIASDSLRKGEARLQNRGTLGSCKKGPAKRGHTKISGSPRAQHAKKTQRGTQLERLAPAPQISPEVLSKGKARKRPPCSLLERIRFRRTAVSKHVHEKKSYNCSSKNGSNILHVQTQNCWQKFSHVLRDCHVKLSSQEIKAYHTGVRRDYIWSEFRMYSWTVYSLLGFVLPCFCDSA